MGQERMVLSPPSAPFCRVTLSKSEKLATLAKGKGWPILPWAISLETREITSLFRVPGTGNCRPKSKKLARVGQNQSLPRQPSVPSCSIFVSKFKGNCPHRPKTKVRLHFPGPFLLNQRPSRVNLRSRLLGNSAQVPRNRAQVGQNQSLPSQPSAPSCSIFVSKSKKTGHFARKQKCDCLSLGHFS